MSHCVGPWPGRACTDKRRDCVVNVEWVSVLVGKSEQGGKRTEYSGGSVGLLVSRRNSPPPAGADSPVSVGRKM